MAEGEKALAELQAQPAPEDFGEPATISRLDPAGLSKDVLDAAFAIDADKTPAFGGVAWLHAYAIIQVDEVRPGTTDMPALDGLGLQMARVWGGVEQQAVLAELRQQLGVKMTDEGRKLIEQGDGGPNRSGSSERSSHKKLRRFK